MSRRQEEIAMLEMWWALAPPSPPRDINSEFIKACKQLAEMVGKSTIKRLTRAERALKKSLQLKLMEEFGERLAAANTLAKRRKVGREIDRRWDELMAAHKQVTTEPLNLKVTMGDLLKEVRAKDRAAAKARKGRR